MDADSTASVKSGVLGAPQEPIQPPSKLATMASSSRPGGADSPTLAGSAFLPGGATGAVPPPAAAAAPPLAPAAAAVSSPGDLAQTPVDEQPGGYAAIGTTTTARKFTLAGHSRSGSLTDPPASSGEDWRGYQDPYGGGTALDPRVGGMPGAFPGTPSEVDQDPYRGGNNNYNNTAAAAGVGAGAGAAAGLGAYGAAGQYQQYGQQSGGYGSAGQQQPYGQPSGGYGAAGQQQPYGQAAGGFPDTQGAGVGTALTTGGSVPAPTVQQGYGSATAPPPNQQGYGAEHHYGRDALIAGGVGAAGVGTYEAARQAEQSRGPLTNREIYGQDAVTPKKVQQPPQQPQQPQQPPFASVPSNKEIYGVDAVTPKPVRPAGAGAAAVGAGAGAAGAGAVGAAAAAGAANPSSPPAHLRAAHNIYPQEVFQPHHQQPTSAATAGGLGEDSATGDNVPVQQQGHHYGRDAAIGAGAAAGAAGAGAYAAGRGGQPPQGQPTITHTTHDIYPESALEMHPHQPTSAATAGGVGFDHATGGTQPPAQQPYGRDFAGAAAPVAGGAGIGVHDYAPEPPATARDPVAAIQAGVTPGYVDQRAQPDQSRFDPVRGGTLDQDGVSHPHSHAHPQATLATEPGTHHARDAAIAGGLGGVAAAGAYAAAREAPPGNATFDPMDPTLAARHSAHGHTLSQGSSTYSEGEGGEPGSEKKRKHRILTFLNKDKSHSRQSSQDASTGAGAIGAEDGSSRPESSGFAVAPAATAVGGSPGEGAYQPYGGSNRVSEEVGGSPTPGTYLGETGGGSQRSKHGRSASGGRNRLQKQPPKKVQQQQQEQLQQQQAPTPPLQQQGLPPAAHEGTGERFDLDA